MSETVSHGLGINGLRSTCHDLFCYVVYFGAAIREVQGIAFFRGAPFGAPQEKYDGGSQLLPGRWYVMPVFSLLELVKCIAMIAIGCGLCEKLCPMKNITLMDQKAVSGDRCTMCYRCVNRCPGQALTLLGKKVVEHTTFQRISGEAV